MTELLGSALITGSARRVGREIALGLARRGLDIAIHYNASSKDADTVVDEIKGLGRKCAAFRCDLGNSEEVTPLIGEVKETFPDLHVLINNASIFERSEFVDTTVEHLQKNFDVHVKAPFILSREFARQCDKGQIINILDTFVCRNPSDYFAYLLSKKSLADMTRMSARALAPGIRVNAVAPGSTLNPIDDDDEDYMAKRAKEVPLQLAGNPGFVIQAIEYLLDNPFVTGECLYVDGGVHIDY